MDRAEGVKALQGGALLVWIFISSIRERNCLLIDELELIGMGLIAGRDLF